MKREEKKMDKSGFISHIWRKVYKVFKRGFERLEKYNKTLADAVILWCQGIPKSLKTICEVFFSLPKWIGNKMKELTKENTLVIIFRFSLVISMFLVLVWNYYYPIFRCGDASTQVCELLLGVALFPLLISWVESSINQKKKETENISEEIR